MALNTTTKTMLEFQMGRSLPAVEAWRSGDCGNFYQE